MRIAATFLPGASGSAAFWSPIVDRLGTSWDIRALDLPGLGSVPSRPAVSSYDDLVDFAARSIVAPAVVVAQSMGTYIALQLALQYPQLVTHLVLSAPTGGVSVNSHGAEDWRGDYADVFPAAQMWARSRVRDLDDHELAAIAMPVLVLSATRDALSPLTAARTLASKIPKASLMSFESDDHWFIHRFADEAAAAIRSFVVR